MLLCRGPQGIRGPKGMVEMTRKGIVLLEFCYPQIIASKVAIGTITASVCSPAVGLVLFEFMQRDILDSLTMLHSSVTLVKIMNS